MEESQWEQKGNVNSAKAHEFGPPHAAKWFFRHHFFCLYLLKSEINKTLTTLMGTSASANPTVMLKAVLCRSAAAVVGSCFRMFWRKWGYHCTRCIALSAESGSIR